MVRSEYERAFGEKVEVRHLQLAAPRFFPQIKDRLDKGERFEDLVAQYSQNSLSRQRGGLLPPFSLHDDTVPGVFAKAAFALKEGEYSNPVESEGSYHVLKLERRLPPEPARFEEVRDKLRWRLTARLTAQAMQDLSARLLMQAELRIEDPALREQYKARQAAGDLHGPVLVGQ
jgi:foldase protein PrsA